MMFYPAEDEKPPFHAEPEEGQVAPELPAGLSNEPEEADAEAAEEDSGNGDASESDPNHEADSSDSPPPADA